jgi:hypothetical protein
MAPSVPARRLTVIPFAQIVAILVASLVLACTGSAGPSGSLSVEPAGSGTRPSGRESIPPSGAPEPGAVPDALLQQVIAAAAADAGVEPADVVVISTEAVAWNDGSLGCPKPGVMYIQQIIQGYRVIVEAGGDRYDYRAGSSGAPKRCEGSLPGGGSS